MEKKNKKEYKMFHNPKLIFKSAKKFLEKLNPKENSTKTTISKVLSKILNRNKTLKQQCNFCKGMMNVLRS